MPEPILSSITTAALTGLAADFLKHIGKGMKGLFKGSENQDIFIRAFADFREECFNSCDTTDENKMLPVFQKFFMDERTIRQFKPALQGENREVDFNLLQEIFVDICIGHGIGIATFDFFRALSQICKHIEKAAKKKEKIFTFSKRDEETNVTYARFKYLRQLSLNNRGLRFTGIPHPQEKREIHLPEVFVMQRARESVQLEDYRSIMQREREGGEAGEPFDDVELQLRRMMPVKREEKQPALKFDEVMEKSSQRRFVVLGKPGSGKSSLLKYLMLKMVTLHLEFHREHDQLLFPILVRIRDFEHACARTRETVDEFLEIIRLRAGLLVETAPDQFGFAHKTFQEYFAATWMADETTLNYDLSIMTDYVDQFIDNAFWHETLLLAIRALPKKQALKVLTFIRNRDSLGIEQDFYHNHYFVMKFIAEQGQWLDNKALELLLVLAQDESQSDDHHYACAETVRNLSYKEKVEILIVIAQDETQDVEFRRICAEAVGNFGFKEKAVELLLVLAQDEKQKVNLQGKCASAVGRLGVKDKAVDILVNLYLAQADKTEDNTRRLYGSLWELTAE